MSKEVEIIKKAMADNKKVFLKEMKQLNDKLDDLDKRLTKHIDFIENVYDNVKNPLGFICNKISSISGNSNYTLENLDVSSHQDYESSDN